MLLSQVCVVVTYWAVFQLGSAIVGERHAVLAILLMVGITDAQRPEPGFRPGDPDDAALGAVAPAFLARHRADQRGYWYALAVDLGLLAAHDLYGT